MFKMFLLMHLIFVLDHTIFSLSSVYSIVKAPSPDDTLKTALFLLLCQ